MTSPQKMAAKFMISASTIRNYEARGLIPPAERSSNGYRIYTDRHAAYLSCIQAMAPAFGMEVTAEALRCIHQDKPQDAMWIVREKEVALYEEKKKVERLIQDIRISANEHKSPSAEEPFTINEVSRLTQVPKSTIRYWEHAGYVTAERNPDNRYRRYRGSHLLKIRLLQALQSSVYSEDTVNFKQSIAAAELEDLQRVINVAERVRTYLDQIIESQMCGISCLHQLIQFRKAAIPDD
ncbi:DNA-binding transcriptional regulator, MerR family [Paenibacillus sp. UNCCL117]|uniref:MerR family DNA-binding transcriptional regulator n=1 Tax=unclassified Paenibacillus TaxID=185978 RepID=UPI0008826FAB|nr:MULTISPECIES: MerR family DNA-binding transcriptional regulator [unclassified Paenibacillus]SDD17205.1 DNA-binding transcriptional regulator, MerR family [Paenibacillus sp. cl123]SFW34910.1 DNA-binding transcriptional regulator, MerR family [Paenibacillus sp. UNCCL117]